jgi:flavorubredoxin
MRNVVLYEGAGHKFILLNESKSGEEEGVRSNQYLILHGGQGLLLDPGGFGIMPRVLVEMLNHISPEGIRGIFLSHQDPDVVGGISTWLELLPDVPLYLPRPWVRFLPHVGISAVERFVPIPDAGMVQEIAPGFTVHFVPAHFLHSQGNINVYDPIAKVLFTGDIGAAVLPDENNSEYVDDFARHLPLIAGFHRRYMSANRAARLWVEEVEKLDIEILAPQHGPVYRGTAVREFLDWFRELPCGVDLLVDAGHFRLGREEGE